MTTSFPETKTGPRFGLAALAATGCLAAVLAAGLPVRAQDNPVLAKVNGAEIRQSDVALAEEELGASLAQMDPATKKDNVLAFLIDLKIVANIAVGYDNIDVTHAKRRGIVVTNTPDVLTEAVAEFTWALILAAARRLGEGERLVRRGEWKGWALDFMLGTELRGKQLGIVGRGRIGQAVAAKAPAFGMRVAFAARQGRPIAGDELSFDELLIGSDVITLHVPHTARTHHLFDRRTFARMKRSALLVNTSRALSDLGLGEYVARFEPGRCTTVPATDIARERLGRPLPNAALLGAFAALTGEISLDSVAAAIRERFPGPTGEQNAAAAEDAHRFVVRASLEATHA